MLAPGAALLVSVVAWSIARQRLPAKAFAELKAQLDADAQALRTLGARRMSDAADKLAQTRLAIIAHVQRRERRRERAADARTSASAAATTSELGAEAQPAAASGGWFASLKRVAGAWWRHHPAHMGLELATPVLSAYAARKPRAVPGHRRRWSARCSWSSRPWRLISVTGLLVALVKSSQLSSMVLSAMSAGRLRKRPPATRVSHSKPDRVVPSSGEFEERFGTVTQPDQLRRKS